MAPFVQGYYYRIHKEARMNPRKQQLSVLFVLVMFLMAGSAHAATNPASLLAYTDPGSGAMLWQLLLSSGILLSFYYSRAKKWFGTMFGTKQAQNRRDDAHN
jgi:hypothetical protein